jgi:hypothetical protein
VIFRNPSIAARTLTAFIFVTAVCISPKLSRSFAETQTTASEDENGADDQADIDGEIPREKMSGIDVEQSSDDPPAPKQELIPYTYDVSMLLISPLGTIGDFGGELGRQRIPPTPLNQAPRDAYIGTGTQLGSLVDYVLMDERSEQGTNQIAKKNGSLEVTASDAGHAHVRRFFEAIAMMPGMNPQNRGRGLDPDRCVSLFTASLSEDGDQLDWVIYDVSDFYEKLSSREIEVAIESVDRETWGDATGGNGWIVFYEPARAFLIIAKGDVQQKIKDMFAEQRGVKRRKLTPPRATGGKKPAKRTAKSGDAAE